MALKRALALTTFVSVAVAGGRDGLAGVSWGPQRVDIFGTDSKDDVFHKYFTAFGWGPDDPKHGNLELFTKANVGGPVSVASWGANRLDFVFVDAHGAALHKYWDGTSWGPNDENGFDKLGKGVTGKLAINAWGANRFDVVGLSADKTYVHKAWTGNGYHPEGEQWESFGGEFASAPAITSWGLGRLDIFGITSEGNVSHKFWDGYQWVPGVQGWEDLGGKGFKGTPVASSPSFGRFDVWAVSKKTGELWHKFWDGFAYHDWESLGGNFDNAPQVVHWSANRIDLLGKDAKTGKYEYKYWSGYHWSDWETKGGPFYSEPALVSIGEGNLNLVGVTEEGKVKLQVWDGSQWLPGYKDWYELGDANLGDADSQVVVVKPHHDEEVLGGLDLEKKIRIELKV